MPSSAFLFWTLLPERGSERAHADAAHATYELASLQFRQDDDRRNLRHALAELQARLEVAQLSADIAAGQLAITRQLSVHGGEDAAIMNPKDIERSSIAERQRYVELLDATLEMRRAQINYLRQTGGLDRWVQMLPNTTALSGYQVRPTERRSQRKRIDKAVPALDIASPVQQEQTRRRGISQGTQGVALCAALTPLALLVHGYHPYAEDGGIYLAGVKYLLDPRLYPVATGFVTAHLHISVMARLVAAFTRSTHLSVMTVMLLMQMVSIFFTLYGSLLLAKRVFNAEAARLCALGLIAASLTIPVAGTSLVWVDPYVTARSFATPLVLLAFASALDTFTIWRQQARHVGRGVFWTVVAIAAAVWMHPLSGGYGAAVLMVFAACAAGRKKKLALPSLAIAGLLLALVLNRTGVDKTEAYRAVAQTRAYWFLANWAWYELLGIVAPLLILLWAAQRRTLGIPARLFALAVAVTAILGTLVAVLFVHRGAAYYAVARVQPLRTLHAVYGLMLLYLGGLSAGLLRKPYLRALPAIAAAAVLFAAQRGIYPHSNHLELPWTEAANPWSQAFLWIRANTPIDAVVALDANYIEAPGEDAQNFRAISERSMFADFSKDGGIAAIRPALAGEWQYGEALQHGLNNLSDRERRMRLPSRVTWLVLSAGAKTSLPCPYRNQAIAVCRLEAGKPSLR